MYPNHLGCFRIGRVGIIDDPDKTLGSVGNTIPCRALRWLYRGPIKG